ncbi:MAG TPA: dienelactone hydrolase family protein [Fimbriimonadaceae bacterium]|nr:dienelactone hydrolase family protein [Fimbriimonadaceae bacterium]
MGDMVTFNGNGDTFSGYLAAPASGTGPGVIVIQEWWGLVGHIKDVCNRLAAEGFTALAPDLYQGRTATGPDSAGELMMALNIEQTEKILRGAIRRLTQEATARGDKVGVVGFCMGGQLSLFAAASNPDQIGACVDYYGIHPNVHPPFENLSAPVLGFFAEFDEYASPAAVRELDAHLTNVGKPHEFHTYPGTHHAFFNDDRPEVYNRQAAEDSWNKMIAFFREHL